MAASRRSRRDAPPPRSGNSEVDTLRAFLDYLRDSIAAKVEGAPEPQVRTTIVPSGTTLLGLVTHLTFVERSMFLAENVTDWKATVSAVIGRQRGTVSSVAIARRSSVPTQFSTDAQILPRPSRDRGRNDPLPVSAGRSCT